MKNIKVIKPSFKDKGGRPIVINSELINYLKGQSPYSKLNLLIRKLDLNQIKYISVEDAAILQNINTPEDLINNNC